MRLTFVVPVLLVALASCGSKNPPGRDLTLDVALALDNNKCVVRFQDVDTKKADHAIAWTNHKVIWRVAKNDCGQKKKINKKALGLQYLKLKSTGQPAAWLKDCTVLDDIPATGAAEFHCQIPSSQTGDWEGVYEYVIDGDEVEPVDPDIGVKRNG